MYMYSSADTATLAEKHDGYAGSLLGKESFSHVVCRERKRAERSGLSLLLLVLDIAAVDTANCKAYTIDCLSGSLQSIIRETDACGWINPYDKVGVVFSGIDVSSISQARQRILLNVKECLIENLGQGIYAQVAVSMYVFPEKDSLTHYDENGNALFYPELFTRDAKHIVNEKIKRSMDIVGSILALALFSPLFLIIAALVKCTSSGPVIFRQERIGQFGIPFTFYKFRTMHYHCNDAIHRKYMKSFIGNAGCDDGSATGEKIFKLLNDSRVTAIGSFLRKSSLDELPQFFNVLRGEMSLVGPRPPIPYEVEDYEAWHRYRILAKKPGITGLWQVTGRSLTAFDGMVRLDLRYIRTWSPWLDLKLLLHTPLAVIRGKGAY